MQSLARIQLAAADEAIKKLENSAWHLLAFRREDLDPVSWSVSSIIQPETGSAVYELAVVLGASTTALPADGHVRPLVKYVGQTRQLQNRMLGHTGMPFPAKSDNRPADITWTGALINEEVQQGLSVYVRHAVCQNGEVALRAEGLMLDRYYYPWNRQKNAKPADIKIVRKTPKNMPPVDMEESQNIDPTSYTTPGSSASLAQPSDPISASSSAISQPSSDKSGLPPVPTPSAKPGTITPILPDASGAITTDPLAPTHPVDVISNLPAELQDSSAIILSSQLVNPETPSTCSPPPMIHPQQAIDRGPSASYSIPAVSSNTSIQPQHPLQQQQKSKREDDEGSRVTATLFRRRQAYNSECQRDWGMQIVAHLVRNNTRSASRQVCVEFVQSELENNSEHLPKTYFDVLIDCIELFTNNDIVDLEELAQCLTKLEKAASEIGDFTHQGWEKADKLRRTFGDAQKSKIINLMRETGQTKSIEEPEVRLVPSCICEYVLSCIFLNYAGVRRTAINAFQSDADGYLDYIAVLSAIWEGGRSVQIAKDVYTEIANLCNCPKEKRLSESVWKDRLYYFDRNSTGRVKTGVLLSEILVDSSAAWRPPFNEWPEDKFRVVIQPWVDGDHCEYIPIFEFMVKHGREWRRQFEKQRKEEEQRRAEQARMDRQEHEEKKRKRGEEGEIKAEEDTEEDDHDQKSLRTNEPDRYSSGHL